MKYFEAEIVCDDELKRACKSSDLKGISFVDRSKESIDPGGLVLLS